MSRLVGDTISTRRLALLLMLLFAALALSLSALGAHGVSSADPSVYAAIGLLTVLIAAVACYVPCRRAMRMDPLRALRQE